MAVQIYYQLIRDEKHPFRGNPLLLYLSMGKIAREKKNNTPEEIFRGQRLKKASQSLPPAGGK